MKIDNGIIGCLSPIEGMLLTSLSDKVSSKNSIVNIGCYRGRSANYISEGAISGCSRNIKLYLIDLKIKDELRDMFYLDICDDGDIISIEGSSHDRRIIDAIPNNVELLFIDGDHSYEGCMADMEDYWPKVISGGIMAIHDAYDTNGKICEPGVRKATFEFMRSHLDEFVPDNWLTSPVHRCDSMCIVQKL